MRIRWFKLIAGAIAAEIAAILLLVVLVAIFGPSDAKAAQAYAEKLGPWVGPVAGTFFSFLGSLWIGRSLSGGYLAQGALFGSMMALIDILLLLSLRAPFEWVFVISNTSKIIAGTFGGFVAGRFRSAGVSSAT